MNELSLQLAAGFFSVILTIITGLMSYMTLAVVRAGNKITKLETSVESTQFILQKISEELKTINAHDSSIAVLNSELTNLKGEVSVLFDRFREFERREVSHAHSLRG